MKIETGIRSLLDVPDWTGAICSCNEPILKRYALYSCARSVLPYWQSRFKDDESMEKLLDAMLVASNSPSVENDTLLRKAIPKRERRRWNLSPPPGFVDENYSDCPADFAGDSIFYAACAMLNDPIDDGDDHSTFETALECLARLFVERDENYDDGTDYQGMANDHLRNKILETLRQLAVA